MNTVPNAQLFIANLPFATTEDEVRELFAPYKPLSVRLCLDRETKKPRGFGFVQFYYAADAAEALRMLDGAAIGGRQLVVKVAELKPRSPQARR